MTKYIIKSDLGENGIFYFQGFLIGCREYTTKIENAKKFNTKEEAESFKRNHEEIIKIA